MANIQFHGIKFPIRKNRYAKADAYVIALPSGYYVFMNSMAEARAYIRERYANTYAADYGKYKRSINH